MPQILDKGGCLIAESRRSQQGKHLALLIGMVPLTLLLQLRPLEVQGLQYCLWPLRSSDHLHNGQSGTILQPQQGVVGSMFTTTRSIKILGQMALP